MLIPALAYFLPCATFTTGMFELAFGNIVSGSSRVSYGVTILFLLLFGVLIGMQVTGLPQQEFIAAHMTNILQGWPTITGILIFAIGMYFFMSIRDKDLSWILLVIYIALFGQQFGNYITGSFSGAFLGSLLMTISGTLVGRSPLRTPSFVPILPAFWFLVPGSLGFIILASLIGKNYFSAVINLTTVVTTVVAISLGLLVGTVIKERIFEASIDLFAQKGFDATSMREIAEVVGIKNASLYSHYKSKDEILEKIVEYPLAR